MQATAIAHPNIALIKYWGKRDHILNLPATGSLSLTLAPLQTRTTVTFGTNHKDEVVLNGTTAAGATAARVSHVLDLIRQHRPDLGGASVVSHNNFPTSAGLASSSSGFAALVVAANHAAGLRLDANTLSGIARQGSGSAARSIFGGFVRMNRGARDDGHDAVATPLHPAEHWPLTVLVALTTQQQKDVPSTDGMTSTTRTSPYFPAWVEDVNRTLPEAEIAIQNRDFDALARLAEASALRMHASAIAADPGVLYWNGATVDCIHAIRTLRHNGVAAFFTIDAGPHVKVFCEQDCASRVEEHLRSIPGVRDVLTTRPGPGAHVADHPTSGP